jgi:tetratricopeptide (TPR) repeat protein
MTQLAFETADIPGLLRDIQGAMQRGDLAGAGARVAQVLRREPDNRDGLYLDAVVRRYQDDLAGALAALDHLLALYPAHGRALQERGHCLLAQGDRAGALAAYQGAVATNAALPAAWRRLAELQEGDAADYALAQHDYLAALPPPLLGVAGMIQENRLSQAEALCRQFLQANPTHAEGMRLLAEIAQRFQVVDEAEFLLESAIAIEPDNIGARYDYARVLNKRQKFAEALDQARHLRRIDPDSMMIASLEADQNLAVGNFDAALEHYRQRVADHPRNPGYHLTLGHVLKTVDAIPEALAAYRAAYGLRPDFGAAYWSLANLKTYRFDDAELAQMEAQEQLPRTALADRYHLCFALGKALEDRGSTTAPLPVTSAATASSARKSAMTGAVWRARCRTRSTFATPVSSPRWARGHTAPDPIFIVGLPRAGSTLLEQILASHSQVEGTMELPNILALAHKLGGRRRVGQASAYPANMADLSRDERRALGEAYVRDTAIHRKLGRPFFIDKMPNNFRHIGLIHAILPNARIIDARRGAMGCCFSGFKQLFAEGQEFTYGLEEVGRYYRDYVRLMDHWDTVLPGKVLRVQYEDVVDDLEGQVRRLLDFLGLPFEEGCIRFHQTERAVRTASSQQVRQPLYRSGVDQWEHFSAYLDPLRAALEA